MRFRFDLKVIGFLLFIWSWLNVLSSINIFLVDGNCNEGILNMLKGLSGLAIAAYFYFLGDNVKLQYK